MQRFASGFATLWLILFVPSFATWLLVVRWGETDSSRFASVWTWVVDLIAFPLILSPVTDWSWQQLEAGSMLTATAGFLILNALWAAIFALPLALVSAWWRKIGDRTIGSTPSGASSYVDPYATSAIPIPGRISSSPLAALYIITIPLGLVWAGAKRVSGLANGAAAGLFWGAIGLFTITFVIVTAIMALTFGFSSYGERYRSSALSPIRSGMATWTRCAYRSFFRTAGSMPSSRSTESPTRPSTTIGRNIWSGGTGTTSFAPWSGSRPPVMG